VTLTLTLTLTWTSRATVHPWAMVHLSHQSQGTLSQQILGPTSLVPTRDLDLHLDLGSRYTSLSKRSIHFSPLAPKATLLSKLSTHFNPLTRTYTDHGTATMSKYTSIHLDPARGQVPAKIEFYLPKQCKYPLVEIHSRSPTPVTSSHSVTAASSERPRQTNINSDP